LSGLFERRRTATETRVTDRQAALQPVQHLRRVRKCRQSPFQLESTRLEVCTRRGGVPEESERHGPPDLIAHEPVVAGFERSELVTEVRQCRRIVSAHEL